LFQWVFQQFGIQCFFHLWLGSREFISQQSLAVLCTLLKIRVKFCFFWSTELTTVAYHLDLHHQSWSMFFKCLFKMLQKCQIRYLPKILETFLEHLWANIWGTSWEDSQNVGMYII
jgi:hypothetical protein